MSKESDLEKGFIIIPAYIAKKKNLNTTDKYIFGLIFGLSSKTGFCWATNEYMTENWGISIKQIQRSISKLIDNKLVGREIVTSEKNGWRKERKLWIATPPQGDLGHPLEGACHTPSGSHAIPPRGRIDNKPYKKEDSKVNNNTSDDKPEESNSCVRRAISREWEDLKFTKDEAMKIRKKFLDKDLGQVDIDFAVLQLRIWAENNPNKWKKRKSPYLNLIGWPLERAIENKIKSLRLERESNYLAKSKKEN